MIFRISADLKFSGDNSTIPGNALVLRSKRLVATVSFKTPDL
jgi:hypothetical protein